MCQACWVLMGHGGQVNNRRRGGSGDDVLHQVKSFFIPQMPTAVLRLWLQS